MQYTKNTGVYKNKTKEKILCEVLLLQGFALFFKTILCKRAPFALSQSHNY